MKNIAFNFLFLLIFATSSFAVESSRTSCGNIFDFSSLELEVRQDLYAVESECIAHGMNETSAVKLLFELAKRAKTDPDIRKDLMILKGLLVRLRMGEMRTREEITELSDLLTKYGSQFLFAYHLTYLPRLQKIMEGDEVSGNQPYMKPSGKIYGGHSIYVSEQPINGKQSLSTRLVGDQLSNADATIIFTGKAADAFKVPSKVRSFLTLNVPDIVRSFSGTKMLSYKKVIFKKFQKLEDGKTILVEEIELRDVTFRERISGWLSQIYELTYLWLATTSAAGISYQVFAPVIE